VRFWLPMSRFLPNAKRSLDSLLNLITDLAGDVLLFFRLLFRSRTALSAEVLFLRKQLAFYEERQVQPRRLNDSTRFSLILWSRLCNWKEALVIVKPETLIGWHRKGFKLFWKWKSQAGRPRIPENARKLIVQMAQENPTWGQARVAAELSVKLGIYVSPRTMRAPIGLQNRCDEATGGPVRRTGGRSSAITPSPSSPAISWS
jgi:putative transposase